MCCGLCLLAACASSPEPTDDSDQSTEQPEPERSPASELPEYHAQSDAERPSYDEAKRIARGVCGSTPEARECRRSVTNGAQVYRGSFSASDADELAVATDEAAVLLRKNGGSWTSISRLEDVDIDHCLVVDAADGSNSLLCRVPAFREQGYALELHAVRVADDGQLALEALDVPKAADVDSVLFAGWKNGAGSIRVRVHDAQDVARGKQTVNMGEAGGCEHLTYVFEPGNGLQRMDTCTTQATADQATGQNTSYESRLSDPLMKRNRQYVRCYRDELVRIKEEAEQRERLTGLCEEGHAPEEVDCSEYVDEDEEGDGDGDAAVADASEGPEEGAEETPPAELAGQIQTRLVIGSPGAPVACQVVNSTMVNEQVETCLCRELMKTEFPPVPQGAFFDVTYPFDFSPDLER